MWSSEPHEGLAICRAKTVPLFLSHSKTLRVGQVPEIDPVTSRSACQAGAITTVDIPTGEHV